MDDITRFDDKLFSILKECGNLPNFFDTVFGFLNRRTDFYYIPQENDNNIGVGMPEGHAELFTKQAFYRWKPPQTQQHPEIVDFVPDVLEETEIETTSEENDICTDLGLVQISRNNIFSPSESYNGAVYNNYSWSQSINEIGIIIKVPANTTTKDLLVSLAAKSILVQNKVSGEVILEGEFLHKTKHLDAIWSLDKVKLDVQLEKVAEIWWDCLLLTEPKINLQKIDASRPFGELSDKAQAKIEELQWKQGQKQLQGLSTVIKTCEDNNYNS